MRASRWLIVSYVVLMVGLATGSGRADDSSAPPCAAVCEDHAGAELATCLAAGRGDDECEAQARDGLESCLGDCDAALPATCVAQCELRARALRVESTADFSPGRRWLRRRDARLLFERCTRRCAPSAAVSSAPHEGDVSQRASNAASGGGGGGGGGGTTSTKGSKLPRCLQAMNDRPLLADYAAYIASHANVQQAMNPCRLAPAVLSWFLAKLEQAEQTRMPPSAPLPSAFSVTTSDAYVFGGSQTAEILGAKLAHILYVEVRNKVPWRLASYGSADLKRIFTLCKWPHPCNHDAITDFAAQYVLDYSPNVAWSVLSRTIDLAALSTPRQAVADLLEHTRGFIHGATYYDASGNVVRDDTWGIRTLDQMLSEKISRHGCWSMTPYVEQLAAALNIPADGVSDYFDGFGHATALFPMTDQVLAHGDDVYNSLLDNTSSGLVLDSFARWQKDVLAYPPGDRTAAHNSKVHDRDMARLHPSAYLMRNYCDLGTGGRAYLESVFETYATAADLDALQARIASLTSGCAVIPADAP